MVPPLGPAPEDSPSSCSTTRRSSGKVTTARSVAFTGHEGVREFFREWTEPLETFRARAETFIDAGDSVIVATRIWARGKGSGVEGEMPQGMVYSLRNGLVTRVDLYES